MGARPSPQRSTSRSLAAHLALDDFGTGYSSLASLEHLPLTRVKLDQSLVTSIDTNARSLAITLAIAGLCRQLGLDMTTEGVERPEQLALLLPHASICLQGYLISRPVSRAELPARVHELPDARGALRSAREHDEREAECREIGDRRRDRERMQIARRVSTPTDGLMDPPLLCGYWPVRAIASP